MAIRFKNEEYFEIINENQLTIAFTTDIIGCPALEDPIVTYDGPSGQLFMYFLDIDLLTIVE